MCLVAALGVGGYLWWLLWGTGIITKHAQADLRQQIQARIDEPRWHGVPPPPDGGLARSEGAASPRERQASIVVPGGAVAILRIPKLHLDMVVVEGTDTESLTKGPGHYLGTAFPWDHTGRVGIAGHRTTYLHPFWSLDHLVPGDLVELVTEFGTFDYRVTGSAVILPSEGWVLDQTKRPSLVLTTCTPRFSASHRLVVFAARMAVQRQDLAA